MKKYTKENSLIRKEPTVKRGNVTIQRATVYGDNKIKVTPEELVTIWKSKPRVIPTALMLAKAECESGFYPYIFRYELGQHIDTPNGWISKNKGNTEFDATSGGLFQVLGKNVRQFGFSDWTILAELPNQLDMFDKLMGSCLNMAKRVQDGVEIDDVYQALNIYAFGTSNKTINWRNALSTKNYNTYLKWLKIYSK